MAAAAAASRPALAGLHDADIVSVMSDACRASPNWSRSTCGRSVPRRTARGTWRFSGARPTGRARARRCTSAGPPCGTSADGPGAARIGEGALFRRVRRGGHLGTGRLAAKSVNAIIRRRAAAAGIDAHGVSGHSFRVASTQSLTAAGATLPELQQAGRWKGHLHTRPPRQPRAGRTAGGGPAAVRLAGARPAGKPVGGLDR